MLTTENIFSKRILRIYTTGINQLDFQFLLRRKYKYQTVSISIVSRNSSMKKSESKFSKFCSFSAFNGQQIGFFPN